jgi:hypothetical protein
MEIHLLSIFAFLAVSFAIFLLFFLIDFHACFLTRIWYVLQLALVTSHAALSPEEYWKSVLPKTPMLKSVSDLLHQGSYMESEKTLLILFDEMILWKLNEHFWVLIFMLLNVAELIEEKSTSVNVGKGGVHVDAGKGKPGGTSVNVGGKGGGVDVHAGKGKPGGTSVHVGKGGVGVDTGKGKPGGTSVGVGKGGVSVHTGHKKKPVVVKVRLNHRLC